MYKFKTDNYCIVHNHIKVRKIALMLALSRGCTCAYASTRARGCFLTVFVFGICHVYIWGGKVIYINCSVILALKFTLHVHISSKTASSSGWVIHFTKIKSVLRDFSDILKAQIEKIMFQRKGKVKWPKYPRRDQWQRDASWSITWPGLGLGAMLGKARKTVPSVKIYANATVNCSDPGNK